ncbi:MAG: ABC transporter permease [Thermomicrobiales bacterium]|nr:ABC transporter permease [Thermomicrobiales bacterium]
MAVPVTQSSMAALTEVRKGATLWQRYRKHKMAVVGLAFMILLVGLAVFAPWLGTIDPTKTSLMDSLQPPSRQHWLGTDLSGRDIWSRLAYAARISLIAGVGSTLIASVIAIILGSISGFYGGVVDNFIMRVTDVIMCIPDLIIIMALVSVLGPGLINIVIAIGVLGWTGKTRLLRAQILAVREKEYVTAARCSGATNKRIMFRYVLPNSFTPILVAGTLSVAGAILTEASLSFLGFGILPPNPSWGEMLNGARSLTRLQENPWIWMPPGIMILLTVLAINFIGDGLQDSLDPRQKER